MIDEKLQRMGSAARTAIPKTVEQNFEHVEVLVLRRARHRRVARSIGLSLLTVGAVVVLATLDESSPDRVAIVGPGSAETNESTNQTVPPPSVATPAKGLTLWPDEASEQFATATDVASAFAVEVLGWKEPLVIPEASSTEAPVWVNISDRSRATSIDILTAPVRGAGGWAAFQIGTSAVSAEASSTGTIVRYVADDVPDGAKAVWASVKAGGETTLIEGQPYLSSGEYLVPSLQADALETAILLFRDTDGETIWAVGRSFARADES